MQPSNSRLPLLFATLPQHHDLLYEGHCGGGRKAVKNNEITHIYAPQYELLTVEKILEFVDQFTDIHLYLPEERDIPSLPRQVIYCPNLKLSFFG